MGAKSTPRTPYVLGVGGPSGRRGRKGKEAEHRKHRVFSMFAGGGGLDYGFDLTDRFEHRACIEWDKAACSTLEANRDGGLLGGPDLKVVQADIAELDPAALMAELGIAKGEVGALIGGPPCQPFSVAGKQLGTADPRGTLLWDYVRWVREVRPDCFLMENVPGLLTMPSAPGEAKGSLLTELLKRFERSGYHVDVFKLDAVDFGTAQFRKRAILIGNRHGLKAREPVRTHGPGLIPHRTLRDALAGLVDDKSERLGYTDRETEVLKLVPARGDYRDLTVRVAMKVLGPDCRPRGKGGNCKGYKRLGWDDPAPTVLTGPNRGLASLCHPDEARPLTLRECARLQGWPDEWVFCGSRSEQYRQVGNAVPVQLAYRLGHVVADMLDDIAKCRDRDGNGLARRGRRLSKG